MRRGVLVAVIAVSLVVAVAASAAVPRWTPKQMQAAIKHKKFGGALLTSDFTTRTLLDTSVITVTSAKCRGLGSHKRTGYVLFQCHVVWDSPNFSGGPFAGDFWTVPWAKSFLCITNVTRGSCAPPAPAHPLPGDPRRKCGQLGPAPSCLAGIAKAAATKDLTYYENGLCVAGAVWTTYNCTWNGGGATVRFVRHPGRWTTNVTPPTG
jgi:hypothetical protein